MGISCPHCRDESESIEAIFQGSGFVSRCSSCGARGAIFDTEHEALKAWSRIYDHEDISRAKRDGYIAGLRHFRSARLNLPMRLAGDVTMAVCADREAVDRAVEDVIRQLQEVDEALR